MVGLGRVVVSKREFWQLLASWLAVFIKFEVPRWFVERRIDDWTVRKGHAFPYISQPEWSVSPMSKKVSTALPDARRWQAQQIALRILRGLHQVRDVSTAYNRVGWTPVASATP